MKVSADGYLFDYGKQDAGVVMYGTEWGSDILSDLVKPFIGDFGNEEPNYGAKKVRVTIEVIPEKIILCIFGSRTFTNNVFAKDGIEAGLKELGLTVEQIAGVIDGAAPGADNQGHYWAERVGLRTKRYAADWENLDVPNARPKLGKHGWYNANAGHDRNQTMAEIATHFIGLRMPGKSTGTDDMAARVEALGKPLSKQGKGWRL